jgi:hypothetical protein
MANGGPFIQPYTVEQTVEKLLTIASFNPGAASTLAGVLGVNSDLLASRGITPTSNPVLDTYTRNLLLTYFSQEIAGF